MSNLCGTGDDSANKLSSYQYPPLPDKQSFRVLELIPGEPNEPIHVRLHFASWNNPPSYDALSYTWGDPNIKVPIICDGKRLECTPNLRFFLETLRPRIKIKKRWPLETRRIIPKSRLLWADALCINQTNNEERGHQVKSMIQIYRKAEAVRVWLGSELTKGDTRAAMESVRNLSDNICRSINTELSALDLDNIYYGVIFDNSRILPDICSLSPSLAESLKLVFSSPWFTRLWVIQEVNSNSRCWIHFGDDMVEWVRVLLVACYIRLKLYAGHEYQFSKTFASHAMTIGTYFRPSGAIITYLQRASRFHSTDARDKVYGLLGMIQTKYPKFPFEVDYEKPILDIYTDLTEVILSRTKVFSPASGSSLDILRLTTFDPSCNWPSWVVRWDRQVSSNLSSPAAYVNAAPNTGSTPIIDRNNKSLELRGLILDDINTIIPIDGELFPASNHQRDQASVNLFWSDFLTETTTAREGQDPLAACAMALTCGRDARGREAEGKWLGDSFKAYLQEILDENMFQKSGKSTEKAQHFRRALRQAVLNGRGELSGRCYFSTDTGFKGCTRQIPRPGDLVCILFGGRHPFILRPHRDGYLLFDHAYVHGVMHGEFVDDWKAGKLPHVEERGFKIY